MSSPSDPAAVYPEGYTLAELMRTRFPEPVWAVPGLIGQGLCLLCGKPKLGKSFLCLGIGMACANGGVALGHLRVQKCDVLYLAMEDTYPDLQERVAIVAPNTVYPDNMTVFREWPRMGAKGLELLARWVEEHTECRVVIIDTLGKIKPLQTRTRTLYDEDYQTGVALKSLADKYRLTLIVIHHTRKAAADDVMDEVSATLGLTGAADQTIILKRERGQLDGSLHIAGRKVRDQELAMRFDPELASWVLIGQLEDFKRSKERNDVLNVIRKAPGAMTPSEVAGVLGKKIAAVKYLMWKMDKEGDLRSVDGRYSPGTNPVSGLSLHTPNSANPLTGLGSSVNLTPVSAVPLYHDVAQVTDDRPFQKELWQSRHNNGLATPNRPLTMVSGVSGVSAVSEVSGVSAPNTNATVPWCMGCGKTQVEGQTGLCNDCEGELLMQDEPRR